MKQRCENPLCRNMVVAAVPTSTRKIGDTRRSLCDRCRVPFDWGYQHRKLSVPGLNIEPPPAEKGPEPLYRVVYVIDVNAPNPKQAAEEAYRIMIDPDSMRPVLKILDSKEHCITVDLSAEAPKDCIQTDANESHQKARRFVTAAGTRCPKCGSVDVSFGSVDIEGQSAYQQAVCQSCEADFYEIYRLVGFGMDDQVHTIKEDFGEITQDQKGGPDNAQ